MKAKVNGPKQKLIHIVGGGFNQVALVRQAKAKGLRVLVTDSNENPPARKFADLFEQIDTTDRNASLRCAEKNHIDFVTTDMTDVAVPTVAFIAETLGLPGIGYETALKFTNKYIMRKALAGLTESFCPESYFFTDLKIAIQFLQDSNNNQNYLVKPVNSQGSKGVHILRSGNIQENAALISNTILESRGQGILIERFVGGHEYSVETFVKDKKVYNLTLTKKYHYEHNPCLDKRNTFLGDVDEALESKLFLANQKIIEALGLPFGMTHAEYKIENGKVYLMEIAARGAGGSISSHIIPYLTGFNTLDALLSTYAEESYSIQIEDYKTRFAVLKFFEFTPGKIKRYLINQKILDSALVFDLNLSVGQSLCLPKDSRDRPGYFVVHGENRSLVLEKEKQVSSAVKIEYE